MSIDRNLPTVSSPLHKSPPSFLHSTVEGVLSAPYHLACYTLKKSAAVVTTSFSWTATKILSGLQNVALRVHGLYCRLHALFVDASLTPRVFGRVLSWIVIDQKSSEKIANLRDTFQKMQTPVFTESAKFLAHYAIEYLKFHLQHAVTLDKVNRPSWLNPIASERIGDKRGYTFCGRVVASFVENNSEMIGRYIELNILGLFSRLATFVQELESGNRYILHDLVRASLEKANLHFYACRAKAKPESQDVTEKAIALIVSEEEEKARHEFEKHFFKSLSEALITICLPQGGKELELPMRSVFASYLHSAIYNVLKNEVLPEALEQGFKEFCKPSSKHALFIEVIESIRPVIYKEVDSQSATHKTDYADQEKLEEAVQGCMMSFINYIKPSWFTNYLPQESVARFVASTICEKLRHYKLQQFMQEGVEKVLPLINEGGVWKEEGQRKIWEMGPISFNHSLHDSIESERRRNERALEREKELHTLMDKPEQELANNGGWKGIVFHYVSGFYKKVTNVYATGLGSVSNASTSVRGIIPTIVTNMMLPEHELLALDLTKVALQTIGVKTKFRERTSKPSVKES